MVRRLCRGRDPELISMEYPNKREEIKEAFDLFDTDNSGTSRNKRGILSWQEKKRKQEKKKEYFSH